MALIAFSLFSPSAYANSPTQLHASTLNALKSGSAVILMRHALAPGFGDPPDIALDDCSTQRNLSEQGRRQAVALGTLLRTHGINEATVLTSAWCRCRDTASSLGYGDYTVEPSLNSFFQNYSVAEAQTQRLKHRVGEWIRRADSTRILVTHQVNIRALTGEATGSGDMVIVTYQDNDIVVLGTVSAPTM